MYHAILFSVGNNYNIETVVTKKVKKLHIYIAMFSFFSTIHPPLDRPLNTTPALYSTLTDAFLDEAKSLDSCKGMKFDAPNNVGYNPYLDALQATGCTINTTVADGNCLCRSISKGPNWDRILSLSHTISNPRIIL